VRCGTRFWNLIVRIFISFREDVMVDEVLLEIGIYYAEDLLLRLVLLVLEVELLVQLVDLLCLL
jgi:hypothetical protein